jgi:hypothetical protein
VRPPHLGTVPDSRKVRQNQIHETSPYTAEVSGVDDAKALGRRVNELRSWRQLALLRTVAQGSSRSDWRLVIARQVPHPHDPTVEAAALLSLGPGDRQ